MRRTRCLLVLTFVGLLISCDQDPFHQRERPVLNGYELERFEDGQAYYLTRSGSEDDGGGVVGGTVVRIGWNDRYIIVDRKATFGGDKDGWMVIDTVTAKITGPYSIADVQSRPDLRQLKTMSAAEAWQRFR